MKSFSRLTKEELCKTENQKACCNRAAHTGMLLFGAGIGMNSVRFVTENPEVLNVYTELSRKLGFSPEVQQTGEEISRYAAEIRDGEEISRLLEELNPVDASTGVIRYRVEPILVREDCCRRAFIRGAFLAGGTVIDPRKNYNLELVTPYLGLSRDMSRILEEAGFSFKSVVRKSKYVLYLKNSESISDFLTYMGAYRAQMELLNIKIEKEIRNDFNRTANSETANLEKTINASVRQVRAIEAIRQTVGLESLPEDLREVAMLRLKHKELSLGELGALMNPPLSKSGVNHRLKKLMKMRESSE